MTKFKSKFTGATQGERFKMLQLIHGLSLEINTGIKVSSKGSLVNAAKSFGWLPTDIRLKKVALSELVSQARNGFGYVPRDSVKSALPKVKKPKVVV